MLNISRIVRLIFSEEAELEYQKLLEALKHEKEHDVKNSENQQLLRSIDEKVERLKFAPDSGIQIPRKLFPMKYLVKYGVNNLWKINVTEETQSQHVQGLTLQTLNHPRPAGLAEAAGYVSFGHNFQNWVAAQA